MKPKVYAHVLAFIHGTIWFFTGWLVAQGLVFRLLQEDGKISPLASAVFIGLGAYVAGIYACVGGISAARIDYLKGKLKLPDEEIESAKSLGPAKNPWIVALIRGTIQWPIFVAIGFALCFVIFPNGLPPKAFGLFTAHMFCVHGAILARKNSIIEARKYFANPPAKARSFNSYMIYEHLVGMGLVNLFMNGLLGYVVFIGKSFTSCGRIVIEADFAVADAFIMNFIIALLAPIGPIIQAGPDFKTGRAGRPAKILRYPSLTIQYLMYTLFAVIFNYAVKYLFKIMGFEYLLLSQAIVLKAFMGAGVAAGVSALAVKWQSFKPYRNKVGPIPEAAPDPK